MRYPKILKYGQVGINKKRLIEHCNIVLNCLNEMDVIMKERESFERGKKVAQSMNKLHFSLHTLKHFELGIDLKKLNKFIK